MNNIEKYCDRELVEIKNACVSICNTFSQQTLSEIAKIALIEINRELDERKVRISASIGGFIF